MVKVRSKAIKKTVDIQRVIGHIKGKQPGPTVVFIGGIHGNEPSGVFALHKIIRTLKTQKIEIKGNIYALSGNLNALQKGIRYETKDLNRLWTSDRMKKVLNNGHQPANDDMAEQQELLILLKQIINTEPAPLYFMDLHTTSSESIPFLTVNDSLLNRWFTTQYPLPVILGIEEHLDGPVLSYINELGYVSFGFEAGQHDDLSSYENQEAFIYVSLVLTGALEKHVIDYHHFHNILAKTSVDSRGIYEIFEKHEISEGDAFQMEPGFVNFQTITPDEVLATTNGLALKSNKHCKIFMPLYQAQGEDGYFLIRKIKKRFFALSEIFRKLRIDKVLPLLPGIRWASDKQDMLIVNLNIARFFATQFFHLMGYRSKRQDKNHLIIKNREAAAKKEDYQQEAWFKG